MVPGGVIGGEAHQAQHARHLPDVAQGVHPEGPAHPSRQHPVPTGVHRTGRGQVVQSRDVKVSWADLDRGGGGPRISDCLPIPEDSTDPQVALHVHFTLLFISQKLRSDTAEVHLRPPPP